MSVDTLPAWRAIATLPWLYPALEIVHILTLTRSQSDPGFAQGP